MEALKLIVPGSYYDNQIYANRLYLWNLDDSITTVDWNGLLESITIPEHLKFALRCAFLESNILYNKKLQAVFQDREVVKLLKKKFQELAKYSIDISQEQLQKFVIRRQDNPFVFPHADSSAYQGNIYVGDESGVKVARCEENEIYPISKNAKRLCDAPALNMAAANQSLALAGGSEGLFVCKLDQEAKQLRDLQPVIKEDCNQARWLFSSLFSSSFFNEGFMADFVSERAESNGRTEDTNKQIKLLKSSEIFKHKIRYGIGKPLFTWGVEDKICTATATSVEVVQYNPEKFEPTERFKTLGLVKHKRFTDAAIIGADSALFGYVIEYDDGLLVINSAPQNGWETNWLEGEPVSWKVFPKSEYYSNQLHVVYDDHLCIHSFNQDYFVNQEQKLVGIKYSEEVPDYKLLAAQASVA